MAVMMVSGSSAAQTAGAMPVAMASSTRVRPMEPLR
jgi:hypothetical protein